MKIPKDDGTTNPKSDSKDDWKDILCDKCGKSCRDDIDMNFEYATVSAYWGFGSKKDLYHDEAQVCEPCYDSLGLKPMRTSYLNQVIDGLRTLQG